MLDSIEEYRKMAEVEESHWWYCSLHFLALRFIQNQKKDISILDAGCGTGGWISFLKKMGYSNITGFDYSEFAIGACKSRGIDIFQGDLNKVSSYFENEAFNIVCCFDVLYFVPVEKRKGLISQLENVVKPGGLLLLNLPSGRAFRGIHDLCVGIQDRFSKKKVNEYISDQWVEVEKIYWPWVLSPIIFIARTVQRLQMKIQPNKIKRSDLALPPKWINQILFWCVSFENRFFKIKPWGSSLFVVLKRKE